jgi:outer membrane protein assembly factor BamB
MTRPRRAAALFVLLFGAVAARAQLSTPEPANLRGESAQTRKRLTEADEKLRAGRAEDAADDLQRILDDSGDDLISIDGKRYRPARWVAHLILAKLPPGALKAYQDRIDEPARRLLDAGKRDRDPAPLWQLLDRYFVSRPSAEGLLLLGDLHFERGEFRTAELLWRRLLPDAEADVPYPGPPTDPAAVRARVVLTAIFQGELDRAKGELAALREKHPDAAGTFAGKAGRYTETLQALLDRPPQPPSAGADGRSWPTFGGDPHRTGRVAGRMPYYWPSRPTWTATIPPDATVGLGGLAVGAARVPFGYPVIAGGHVYLTDGVRVLGYDLLTGVADSVFNPLRLGGARGANRPAAESAVTLTAAGGRLTARLGPPTVRPPDAKAGGESTLACFAPPDGFRPGDRPRPAWQVQPPAGEGKPPTTWEGAPLVAGGRMWAALARFEGGRLVHVVAGFDPADPPDAPDRPAWVVEVSDIPLSPESGPRTRQELLTLAGRNVVFCSNTGAVVALDAASGRKAWAFRYPRAARRAADAPRPADPAPAVASGGRVFVAPADADRVFALDTETGRLLWESSPVEDGQVQILGVARNRLIVTVTGPVRGIRGLNVATGSHREPEGWVQHDGGGLLGAGRGLVTDDAILWPTRAGLFFLRPEDGFPLRPPLPGSFGHLAYADGVLVTVTPTEVRGFVSDARRFGGNPRADADPDRQRFEELIDESEGRLAAGDTAAARAILSKTARGDLPAGWRAWAAARLLLLTPRVDDFAKLPPDAQAALQPALLGEWVTTAGGELVTLGTLLARHTGSEPLARRLPSSLPAGDHDPDDTPRLRPIACVSRTFDLPPGSLPLRPIPGAPGPPRNVFVTTGREVLAVPLTTGGHTAHAAAGAFTHAADLAGGFVAAGPHAVALYGPGRDPCWVFRVPDTDPLPDSPGRIPIRSDDMAPVPGLSSFVLAGGWLFARLGEEHLVSLDLEGRRVAWVLGANGRPGFRPYGFGTGPQFGPNFLVTERLVIAQLSDGRRWMVRAETGRVLDGKGSTFAVVPPGFGAKTAPVAWPLPPAQVDANRVALPDGPGLVRLLNLSTGRAKWSFGAGGEASLTGEPPQVRAWGDAVVIAVRRNHGIELERVGLADGRREWADGPAFLDADRVDLSAADADAERMYVPAGGVLAAISLADGTPTWETELPAANGAGGWAVRAGPRVVIAYPQAAIPREPFTDTWDRVIRSYLRAPLVWRLPGLAGTLYDAWVGRTVPVLLFDPESGELLRHLDVPARGPLVTAYFGRDLAVVATGEQVCWLK